MVLGKRNIINYFYIKIFNMPLRKIQPPFLKKGDEVAIISPSFAIDEIKINDALKVLEGWGLKVHVGKNVFKKAGPFAGTDEERLTDLQEFTDNIKIKAIICSRGGYGMLRIIDRIDFSQIRRHPKWYVGFSDISVLHLWLCEKFNTISIHGEMPLNYANSDRSPENLGSLHEALFGDWRPVEWEGLFLRPAHVSGEVTGGNLSMIYSLSGTPSEITTKGKILFIEEVGEYLYHLDRMLTSLKLAGKLSGLIALVAGGFSKMEETKTPWGKTPQEIISGIVSEFDYPVFFNFPAGHVSENRAFYIGKKAEIRVKGKKALLSYS
jgi:muramoyltetrapeptide carboxypeptidase